LFPVFYILELILKLLGFGKNYFLNPWLLLEFIIVLGYISNKIYMISQTTVDMMVVLRLLLAIQSSLGIKLLIILNSLYSSLRVITEMLFLLAIFLFFYSETGS
jgi:hypothetical protein